VQYSEVGWICAITHILNRWKHHFSQLLNVPGVNYARQNAVHKTELLMPKSSTSEVEMANEENIYMRQQVVTKFHQSAASRRQNNAF